MLPRRSTYTLLASCLIICASYNQVFGNKGEGSVFDWFYRPDEVVEVNIQADIDALSAQKMTNDQLSGLFTVANAEGKTYSLPIKIRARGRFRRRLCEFPPLKLDFDKDSLVKNGFNKYDEYKLVTHCFDNQDGQSYILKEYLAYRLYQQLTDNSFRVQLLKIKYIDENGKRKTISYGFLIEDEKEMADRLHCDLIEGRYNVHPDSLLRSEIHRHDIFQYMVCNTDWNLPMVRNMKMLWSEEKQGFFVVPYDFDFSGLVSTAYAVPNADIGQKSIRERHYMGIAHSGEELQETLAWFRSRRNALLSYIKDFKLLGSTDRRDMMKYLDSFYDMLEDGSFITQVGKK